MNLKKFRKITCEKNSKFSLIVKDIFRESGKPLVNVSRIHFDLCEKTVYLTYTTLNPFPSSSPQINIKKQYKYIFHFVLCNSYTIELFTDY